MRLEYVLAVPAARYGEFRAELQSLDAKHDAATTWVDEMRWATGDEKDPADPPRQHRLVVAHDPVVAQRRSQARREQMRELIALGQQWGGRLDAQDAGQRRRGRPLSDSGAKARLYHAVKDANLAHLIKVDLHSELFQFTVDEQRLQYLEGLDGKLLLVTNTDAPAAEVVQRYKSLADIERGFRALKVRLALRQVGRDGYTAMLRDDIALSRALYATVAAHPELEAVSQNLSIAVFRYVPLDLTPGAAAVEEYLNRLNTDLLTAIQLSGRLFVSNAVLGGKFLLRSCIVNFRTTLGDVEAIPEIIAAMGRDLDHKLRPAALAHQSST